jgi:hypothetical protein
MTTADIPATKIGPIGPCCVPAGWEASTVGPVCVVGADVELEEADEVELAVDEEVAETVEWV